MKYVCSSRLSDDIVFSSKFSNNEQPYISAEKTMFAVFFR